MVNRELLRLAVFFLYTICLFNNCDKDNPTEPSKNALSDYVVPGVSNGQPSFTFPKETAEGYVTSMFTNIQYNNLGQIISFDAKFSFPSGNVYNIQVSNIQCNSVGTPTSYKAEITATVNGKTMSGTLIYP